MIIPQSFSLRIKTLTPSKGVFGERILQELLLFDL